MRAFTLVETLVYIALFGILIGGFVVSAYGLFESSNRNLTKAMLQQEKDFVIGKINWALSGAQTVTVPAVGASSGTLTLTKYGDPTQITITTSGGALTVGGSPTTNTNVTVNKLVFIHTHAGGTNPESVEAGFTISVLTQDGKTVLQTASTTRYIRK
jgi:type II secretory pathway pseudopilin PulG